MTTCSWLPSVLVLNGPAALWEVVGGELQWYRLGLGGGASAGNPTLGGILLSFYLLSFSHKLLIPYNKHVLYEGIAKPLQLTVD